MTPPHGKAKDYAPGEERYTGATKRFIYRHGYASGLAGAVPEHNPQTSKPSRTIWEAGRARGAEDAARTTADTDEP